MSWLVWLFLALIVTLLFLACCAVGGGPVDD